jgi:nucleotide-binding universal stress UspA family protein
MPIRTIVVATDFSDLSQAALMQARELALALGARVHFLHVVDELAARYIDLPDYPQMGLLQTTLERGARARMDALVAQQPSPPGAVGEVLTSRSPAETIVSYARDVKANLIVMGTHARAGVERFFLGSVAERVLRTAPCAVLNIRQGTESPQTDVASPHAAA